MSINGVHFNLASLSHACHSKFNKTSSLVLDGVSWFPGGMSGMGGGMGNPMGQNNMGGMNSGMAGMGQMGGGQMGNMGTGMGMGGNMGAMGSNMGGGMNNMGMNSMGGGGMGLGSGMDTMGGQRGDGLLGGMGGSAMGGMMGAGMMNNAMGNNMQRVSTAGGMDECCSVYVKNVSTGQNREHHMTKSKARCKTAVTPLLMHWSYCSLALSHRNVFITSIIRALCRYSVKFLTAASSSIITFVWGFNPLSSRALIIKKTY